MNCKPGDLAVFVRSTCGNEGKIVRCNSLMSYAEAARMGFRPGRLIWQTDEPSLDSHGCFTNCAPDDYLRPIRDNDGKDETLSWADVPQQPQKVAA